MHATKDKTTNKTNQYKTSNTKLILCVKDQNCAREVTVHRFKRK